MADTIRESNMFGFQILTKTCKQRHGNHTKSDSSGGWFQPMPNIFFLVFSFPRRVGKYVKKSLLTWIKMEPKMLGNPMISGFFRDVHPTTEMVIL